MDNVATPMPAVKAVNKIVTLNEVERANIHTMLDNHALNLTDRIDAAIEVDDYNEAKRLALTLVKTTDALLVVTK